MKFSVIVPAHNEETHLFNSICSITDQSFSDYEIIIINDNSSDNTAYIANKLKKRGKIRVFHGKFGSAAATRNFGAKQARGEILIFHDADCVANKQLLENMSESFESGFYEVSGVASRTLQTKPKTWIERAIHAQRTLRWETKCTSQFLIGKERGICVANMKRSVFEKLNGYDESIFYFEDEDLTNRFFDGGYQAVYNGGVIEYHHDPATLKETIGQSKSIGKAIAIKIKTTKKGYSKLLKPIYSFFYLTVLIHPIIFLLLCIPLIYLYRKLEKSSGNREASGFFLFLFIIRNNVKLLYFIKHYLKLLK